jgi:renalase
MKIAIIGAGFSGCNIYHHLNKHKNIKLTLFEKSRGVGGRISTKYIDGKLIDHGTYKFKTKNIKFKNFLKEYIEKKILKKRKNYYIPTNGMNKLCSHIINEKDLITNSKIESIKMKNNKWYIKDSNNRLYEKFDKVIITIPSPQILELNIKLDKKIENLLSKVVYKSIYSIIHYSNNIKENIIKNKNVDINNSKIIKKRVNNSLKYNYNDFISYIYHIKSKYSNHRQDIDKIINKIKYNNNQNIIKHFWKYAITKKNINKEFIYKNNNIGFCGDYFKNKNLEGSFNSSYKLYKTIVKSIY